MAITSFGSNNFLTGLSNFSSFSDTSGLSAESFYDTEFLDKRHEYQEYQDSLSIETTGKDAALSTTVTNIATYLAKGREDVALEAYNNLLNEMKSQERYSQLIDESGNDTQLRAVARQLIESELGCDLAEFISENTRTSLEVEKQQCYRGQYCDSTTQEELLKEMCNITEEEGHLNGLSKGWHSFWGFFTKGYNSVFGDGKKH